MNREIKFRGKCLETGKEYNISTVDKPRDNRGAHNFKGRQNNGGYWIRLVEGHPNADKRGYIREHRLIMEEKLGRLLLKAEIVHHINGDMMDNEPDNLELYTSQKEHAKLHAENIERQDSKGYIKGDPKLEGEKYRLYNKRLGTTEIYTLSRLINTKFQPNTFEHRGKYVGLKDKNGKEIYEGDVLNGKFVKCMPHNGEYALVKTKIAKTWYSLTVLLDEKKKEWRSGYEVIGNIYENPELIKLND